MAERHVSDDLPMLLTGDATRDVVMAAAMHLRSCPDCQQELVSAVVAHASLTSAHRFAPEIVASDQPLEREQPFDAGPLPDMSTLFAQARKDAQTNAAAPVRHRRRLMAVAAAAAIVVGAGATVTAVELSSSSSNTQTIQLDAFGSAAKPGTKAKVTVAGSRLRVDATSLPTLDSHHVYELWVTDKDRKNMQSVGQIGNDNKADLTLPSKVMSQYNDFEVSIQRTNDLKYSGYSVLRGNYG